MIHRSRALLALLCTGAIACHDTTAPITTYRTAIFNINMVATANAADTVRISFDYAVSPPCHPLDRIDARTTATSVTFAVWERASTGLVCAASSVIAVRQTYNYLLLPGSRSSAFSAIFEEPTGGDSTRTVQTK